MRALTGHPNLDDDYFEHPLCKAKSDTSPGDKTGTPLTARWLNEFFGFVQAAMNGAHLTPSGTADVAGDTEGDIEDCQILQAIQAMFCTPGQYVALASTSVPTGSRLLKLEGQYVLAADYPRLVDATYCGDANNATWPAFYRTSDSGGATRSTTGAYFWLPDLRGAFLRGADPTAINDPDGASKKIGGSNIWQIPNHGHEGLYTQVGEGGSEIKHGPTPEGSGSAQDVAYYGATNTVYIGGIETDNTSMSAFVSGTIDTGPLDQDLCPYHHTVTWCITY